MFLAWGTGAALVVPTRAELLEPVEFVRRTRLTHWYSVPSVISSADRLGTLRPGAMPTLRFSMFAGEPLMLAQARAWRRAAPGSEIDNIYGPTELAACCDFRLDRDPERWPVTGNGTVPIGLPYTGMEYLLRDGELCMARDPALPGYLDPAANADRFVTGDGSGGRRSGRPPTPGTGPATWCPEHDGALVHLGRLDHQIKVRGQRVEIGEIEAALRRVPGIRDAVVGAHDDGETGVELRAAYTGLPHRPGDLAATLGRTLPAYMVPALVEHFDELPLTFNGKIDRLDRHGRAVRPSRKLTHVPDCDGPAGHVVP